MILGNYNAIVISVSGGKDSQTIMGVVMQLVREQMYHGNVIAIHADTGAEWPQSAPHCRMLCEHYHIPLAIAKPARPLPDHIEHRFQTLATRPSPMKPGWPSSQCRYCTSDCKRNPIESWIRGQWPISHRWNILVVTGERRQESSHRTKLPEQEPNTRLSTKSRTVTSWRPILDYTLIDVWEHIRKTCLPRHIAYDRGNERLSCSLCVLATDNDIRNGAEATPQLAEKYLDLERRYNCTFKNKKSLATILNKGEPNDNTQHSNINK